MGKKKISQLTNIPVLTGEEHLPLVKSGVTIKSTLNDFKKTFNKNDVGLSNVDNTADLDKPMTAVVQSALMEKANINHIHEIPHINDLQSILDAKASLNHQHQINNITGLESELTNKANVSHIHTIPSIVGLQTSLDGKLTPADIINKSDIGHQHTKNDITDLGNYVEIGSIEW